MVLVMPRCHLSIAPSSRRLLKRQLQYLRLLTQDRLILVIPLRLLAQLLLLQLRHIGLVEGGLLRVLSVEM